MYTILMLNQKGGVGKTTIADELSFALERRGKTVAFVMDFLFFQGLSFSLAS